MPPSEPPEVTADGPLVIFDVDPDADDRLPSGSTAGDYAVERFLGRGGAGMVYLAVRGSDQHRAALKVLRHELASTSSGVERFFREVRTVHKIKHPNIIDIYDCGRLQDGRPYYAMELLEGRSLRVRVESRGRLSPEETMPLVTEICAGLSAAHAEGIVHRDLKLDNILLGLDGQVKIVDFGIAKMLAPDPENPGLTSTGQQLGTPTCMAPEQIRGGTIDQRVDIYALGVVVYNLLTGTPPFRGEWDEVCRAHLINRPRPPSAVAPLPPGLDPVILRCLEKDPEARYPNVEAFLADYRVAILGEAAPVDGRLGIGVLVRAETVDESDDEALAEASIALDSAAAELRAAGFQIPLLTSSEVMGVVIAPQDAEAELQLRREAVATAQSLHDHMRTWIPTGVRVCVTVHADLIELRAGTDEVVGGPLLVLSSWGPAEPGVSLTMRFGKEE